MFKFCRVSARVSANIIVNEEGVSDTTFKGHFIRLINSDKKIRKVFGFYDGEDFFIDIRRGVVFRDEKYFTKVDYTGAFPFIELDFKKPTRALLVNTSL
jgi:hypothetical protein